MTITNLHVNWAVKRSGIMPLIVFMHGWSGTGSEEVCRAMAADGYFVITPDMRGRNGASGVPDASGLEIYDIYNAIEYVIAKYPEYVSSSLVSLIGTSGGGGNAFAAACKFPDTFSCIVPVYGISDYGRDPVNSWYVTTAEYSASVATAVGGTPEAVPNNYYARDATEAIGNYSGGKLVILHDEDDNVVPFINSQRIVSKLDSLGYTNYVTNFTNSTNAVRWTHGSCYPVTGDNYLSAKQIWLPQISSSSAWTIPASGTVTVIGYIVTKRFTIWLNSGLDAAAAVVYNTATDTYTVTPLTTGDVTVVITQGAKTATATISEATEMVVT